MGAPLTTKKKNQVVQWRYPFYRFQMELSRSWNGAPILPYKIAMELGALFEFHLMPNHHIPTAPGPSLQPPARPPTNNHATTPWSFFVCSMFPIPNIHIRIPTLIKSYTTTTMSSTNLHNIKNDITDSALLAPVFLCYCSNYRMNKAAFHAQLNYSFN